MSQPQMFSEHDGIVLYHGDCREVLAWLPENSVDSCVCDPPYDLTANKKGGTGGASVNLDSPYGRARITTGFMGKRWDGTGVAFNPETWSAVLRVLKPGGYLLAFGGSRTYHRLACAIEDAGFEIRDQIQWIYGSGFPKSLDVSKAIDAAAGAEREVVGANPYNTRRPNPPISELHQQAGWPSNITAPTTDAAKQWDGWGTALKPAHEPIVMARAPLIGTVAQNVLEHGTGGLNIGGCRVETSQEDQEYISERIAGFNQTQSIGGNGKYQGGETMNRSDSYDATKGRWPANVIHDGSDEVLAGFPDAPGALRAVTGKEAGKENTSTYGDFTGQRKAMEPRLDSGSAARFFYCAKASQEDRNEGLEDLAHRSAAELTNRKEDSAGLKHGRAGTGHTSGSRNHHPTVKPTELMRYLVRLITPPGGTVLDPFAGSGSTGKACALEDARAILIEKELEYCELASRRVRLAQPRLFAGAGA